VPPVIVRADREESEKCVDALRRRNGRSQDSAQPPGCVRREEPVEQKGHSGQASGGNIDRPEAEREPVSFMKQGDFQPGAHFIPSSVERPDVEAGCFVGEEAGGGEQPCRTEQKAHHRQRVGTSEACQSVQAEATCEGQERIPVLRVPQSLHDSFIEQLIPDLLIGDVVLWRERLWEGGPAWPPMWWLAALLGCEVRFAREGPHPLFKRADAHLKPLIGKFREPRQDGGPADAAV
jgi:hypothetical protein